MKNNNVKHFTEYGYEVLVTNCKKVSTAVRRFDSFLSDYDNYIRENVLRAFMNVEVVGYTSDGDICFHGLSVSGDCRCDVFYTDLSNVYRVEISFSSKDTTSDTSDTTDTITICLGSLDDIQIEENKPFLPVPLWFYQRANIYIWSAILSAYNCWYYCDRRKRVIVKPVRISPCSCYPVRISPYGMPPDCYPYKMFVDGSEAWDCRSRSYNEYLSDLVGAPPYDLLPF